MGRGKLVFKGDEKSKKKKKKKSKLKATTPPTNTTPSVAVIEQSSRSKADNVTTAKPPAVQMAPTIQQGKGKITTSSTAIYGTGTNFNSQLKMGDAIIVKINNSEEMRIVKMRLSDISISISTPFSQDLTKPTPFTYITKPKDYEAEKKADLKRKKGEKEDLERLAFGTYSGKNNQLVYREKTEHGSYRIRREALDDEADVSRGSLLKMRTTRKSDKFC